MIGYDPRQPVAYNVLQHSIIRQASSPVQITPLVLKQLPIKRRGLTEFTFSRFLVPWLCDYKGSALFLDADMVVTGDICELFKYADPIAADVHVMQEQEKFEWASAMLFNNMCCTTLTPEAIDNPANNPFSLAWARRVGTFPKEWNQILGYGKAEPAKLYHFTRGLPVWKETQGLPEDVLWIREARLAGSTCSYQELMGNSVHAQRANADLRNVS